MKQTRLLMCLILILFSPLICIGANITHKVGAMLRPQLTIQNVQNLSFGDILPELQSNYCQVVVQANTTVSSSSIVTNSHPGIIKITGYGTVAIASTPPTVLTHVSDSSKTLPLTQMEIVYSDGSAISNMNNVEMTNSLELKTIGNLNCRSLSADAYGEYQADWPITINYAGTYEPE